MRKWILAALPLAALAACATPPESGANRTNSSASKSSPVDGQCPGADASSAVVVTGSRVSRPQLSAPSPVARVDSEQLNLKGAVKSEQFSSALPPASASPPPEPQITEQYEKTDPNPVKLTTEEPVSTFSSDVDTAAYSVMRRYISSNNQLPPSDSVRVEEYVNYFDYQYTEPKSADAPFAPTIWVTPSPWNAGTRLLHIGVKGYDLKPETTPDANIVLLLDVSGSMQAENKLPLVKKSVELLVDEMSKDDRIAIVVYAGAAGVVLEPTPGNRKTKIIAALNCLEAGGSTAGGEGLALAYKLAEENFAKDKVNRIILASDGDFNVGVVDADSLEDFVARKRKTGIYLTILGFGEGNYNDVIAQKLAQAGNGAAAYIDTLNEARKVLVREFRSTLFPIAKDLKFQVEFNPAVVAEYRLIGYETRLLNREDFNNDAIDAGDIGSGHTVTALYELALVGSTSLIDDLRYQPREVPTKVSDEWAFVRLRYKLPGEETSRLIEVPYTGVDPILEPNLAKRHAPAHKDADFAAAVAAFGQKLQRAGYTDRYSYDEIIALAQSAKSDDPYGDRAEFINLVRAAAKIDADQKD